MTALPNKLSELLLLAVKDAKACEAMPDKYVLDMWDWHVPYVGDEDVATGACHVCLAGSVIAQTLGASPENEAIPGDYDGDTHRALVAIDEMRRGDFMEALKTILARNNVDLSDEQHSAIGGVESTVSMAYDASDNGRCPWHIYEQAAALLAEAGL